MLDKTFISLIHRELIQTVFEGILPHYDIGIFILDSLQLMKDQRQRRSVTRARVKKPG